MKPLLNEDKSAINASCRDISIFLVGPELANRLLKMPGSY